MPWHQSKSDPRKFYDSAHQVVAVAQTAEQAALIVRAVNSAGVPPATIRLQEPSPSIDDSPLETFHDDDCCKSRLMRANRTGESWTCPRCGTEWRARMVGTVKHWAPVSDIAVFQTRC